MKYFAALFLGLVVGGVVTEQLQHGERIDSLEATIGEMRATIEEMRIAAARIPSQRDGA
jgi:hypothetical protein